MVCKRDGGAGCDAWSALECRALCFSIENEIVNYLRALYLDTRLELSLPCPRMLEIKPTALMKTKKEEKNTSVQ
jgi:hypothetical protein